MADRVCTYRNDLCYINWSLGHGVRRERVVPRWYWHLVRLLTGRRYEVWKSHRILYERAGWPRCLDDY